MDTTTHILLTGAGATAFIDVWALARLKLLNVPLPNHALVGRWLAMLVRGPRTAPVAQATPVRGEALIGWTTHYVTGVVFAALLPAIWGEEWLRHPTPIPALLVGIVTVAAPFLILQPALGAGVAASRTPRPGAARLQSVLTHAWFGVGLFVSALAARALAPAG